jgi:long-subunit acyl-CoA synthetase (AMP-forming)
MEITRSFDLLEQLKEKYAYKTDILSHKRNGTWVKFSVDDYYENSHLLSYGFLAMGLQPQDKVITILQQSSGMEFIDMDYLWPIGACSRLSHFKCGGLQIHHPP